MRTGSEERKKKFTIKWETIDATILTRAKVKYQKVHQEEEIEHSNRISKVILESAHKIAQKNKKNSSQA